MSDIHTIPDRTPRKPFLTGRETNKVLGHLRSNQGRDSLDANRSLETSDGKSSRTPRNENLWAEVKAHSNLPKWAVFTIESIGSYRDSYPYAKTKQVDGTEDYQIYLTCEQYDTITDVVFFPQIIGTHRPHKVIYSGDAPKTGDKLGVVPNSFVVSKDYTGLIAFSDGEEDHNYVWVVKDIGAGADIRIGRTTVQPYSGSGSGSEYPERPANSFWVEFGIATFTEEPGWQCLEFTADGSYAVVFDINDAYHEEGDYVKCFKLNGKWFMAENPEILFKAKLSDDLCSTNKYGVTQLKRIPDELNLDDRDDIGNLYNHRAPSGQDIVILQTLIPNAGSGSGSGCVPPALDWNIIEVEQRPVCMVNGVKDSEACVYYGSLAIVAEWCPAGEKDTGCMVHPWGPCPTTGSGSGSGSIVCTPNWELIICDTEDGSGSGTGQICDCCPEESIYE